jgi:hypothetical protein
MSWQIFKDNILRYANNPEAIQDIDTIAKVWAIEYDGAVKRGGDSVNRIAVKQGNVEGMTQIFKAALLKGQSSPGPYDLVGEMGNGVLAYWGGAILNEFPIPTIPAPGSTINVSIVSNLVNNVGVWQPPLTISTPSAIEASQIMSEEEIIGAKEDLEAAKQEKELLQEEIQENPSEEAEFKLEAVEEQIEFQEFRLETGENVSAPYDEGVVEEEIPDESNTEPNKEELLNIGLKIVKFAKNDIGTLENPLPPNKPENSGARVLEMLKNTGINGPAYWCAAAVTTWYKAAGAKYPKPGSASCDVWMNWGKKNKLFSTTPVVGAAILYGSSTDAHHIGIVEKIENGIITTIEGNTSGGGFNRNGVGVFRKTPNKKTIVGYVLPSE